MCHAVSMAIGEVLETGIPVSVSVMFACPWYQEAVAGRDAVPSLVRNSAR